MTDSIEQRLADAGHSLPVAAAPIAAYVATVESHGMLYISGQISFAPDGSIITGHVGQDLDVAAGRAAAERCGLMLIAQMKAALGDLARVERVVKLGVFVSSGAEFTAQPEVANGASELMVVAFGDAGRHARSAVSVPVLPRGAAVEIDAVIAIRG
ncbi:MAG: RidA family protein [Sphingopyxis sp.]